MCYQHFKLDVGSIRHGYSVIYQCLENLYWNCRGFEEMTDSGYVKESYMKSHARLRCWGITPLEPVPDGGAWTEDVVGECGLAD